MNYYIDSSALMKLIIEENESDAIRSFVGHRLFTSVLTRIEVSRALAKAGHLAVQVRDQFVSFLDFLPISEELITSIETLPIPISVRSLDSIHIGSARLINPLIGGVITYDKKMQEALTQLGIKWFAPEGDLAG
jgi:predicted nucleic acid-binding protein